MKFISRAACPAFLIFVLSAVFYSCSKDSPVADESATVHLLVGSYVNGDYVQSYFRNGVQVATADPLSGAQAFTVDHNDVYIVGKFNFKPALWKNGVLITLPSVNYFPAANANDVAVANGHVYVSGYDGNTPVYWIDNKRTVLEGDSGAYVHCVSISGTDVYFAGTNRKVKHAAVYWKNGKRVDLTDYSVDSGATGMAISGSDVYIMGNNSPEFTNIPAIWKNGVIQLVSGPSLLNAMFVDGSDVYLAGLYGAHAAYWKNGTLVDLGDGYASKIVVHNGSVYVAGSLNNQSGYWKNGVWVGVPQVPGSTNTGAISIVVQ